MSARFRIGIDLGGTKIEGAAIDACGSVCFRHRVATPAQDYRGTIEAVISLIRRIEQEIETSAPVGIGIPGTVSPATGLIKNANSIWLIGRPLQRDLESALGQPVRLANDANCFALSEATDGAGAAMETVFGVILGTGVGGGIAIRRQILAGANAIAGEWGHNPMPWPTPDEVPGPACWCGRSGCLETFLSGPALGADHHRHCRSAAGCTGNRRGGSGRRSGVPRNARALYGPARPGIGFGDKRGRSGRDRARGRAVEHLCALCPSPSIMDPIHLLGPSGHPPSRSGPRRIQRGARRGVVVARRKRRGEATSQEL